MNDILKLGPYGMAAYASAWIIYLGYLAQILLRMKKVSAEREELDRTIAHSTGVAPTVGRQ